MKESKEAFQNPKSCAAKAAQLFLNKTVDLELTSGFMMGPGRKNIIYRGRRSIMSQFANKQSTARLRLVKPDGTPAAYQQVKADQISHQFLFGCGAFDAVERMKTQDEKKRATTE